MKRPPLLLAATFAVAVLAITTSLGAGTIRVVDGDTVRQAGERVRLVGLNAPEIDHAGCPAERRLGLAAKARLKELVAGGATLQLVPCACPPGAEGTMACNYGRRCGVLRVGGRDVTEILIAEGLAVPFQCGRTSCPKLPCPWCKR